MKIEILPVDVNEKEVLRNLLEKYDYEFSQYDKRDVNKLGLYGYSYLDNYWTEKDRWAFFIYAQGHLAGFVMVNKVREASEETDFSMSEFFVMYKYRGLGIGKSAAFRMFDMFKGRWQLKRHPKNTTSVCFWDKVISEYTGGDYKLIESYPGTEYDDGTLGDIYFFTTQK